MCRTSGVKPIPKNQHNYKIRLLLMSCGCGSQAIQGVFQNKVNRQAGRGSHTGKMNEKNELFSPVVAGFTADQS